MKVERKEKAFEPVVITLETEEDLFAIRRVLRDGLQSNSPSYQIGDSYETSVKALYQNLLNI